MDTSTLMLQTKGNLRVEEFDEFHNHYNHVDLAVKSRGNTLCYRKFSNTLVIIENLIFGDFSQQSNTHEIKTINDDRVTDFKLLSGSRVIMITNEGLIQLQKYTGEILAIHKIKFTNTDAEYKETYSFDVSEDEKYIVATMENEEEGSTIELLWLVENKRIERLSKITNTQQMVSLRMAFKLAGWYIITALSYESPYQINYYSVNERSELVHLGSIEDGIDDCAFDHAVFPAEHTLVTGSGNSLNIMTFLLKEEDEMSGFMTMKSN